LNCVSVWELLGLGLGIGVITMAVAYLAARRRRDIGWVDMGWASGVILAAITVAGMAGGNGWRRTLVAAMAVLWGLRLAAHMLKRLLSQREDSRYVVLREYWGERTRIYLPLVFAAEALLVPLFALPLIAAMQLDGGLGVRDWLALLVWAMAVAGEGVADAQLARFRSAPRNRGKTFRQGLWRYSRHPNYFFEWVHWWAYVVMTAGTIWFWPALLGPFVMGVFLLKLTGIPHAERQALAHRGEDYAAYQRTTNAFFPWFPRKEVRDG